MKSRNASFFEEIFPYKEISGTSSNKRTYDNMASSSHQEKHPEDEPRRSKRLKATKTFGPDYIMYIIKNVPQTFKEAMSILEAPFWKEAINSEIDSIMHNHT